MRGYESFTALAMATVLACEGEPRSEPEAPHQDRARNADVEPDAVTEDPPETIDILQITEREARAEQAERAEAMLRTPDGSPIPILESFEIERSPPPGEPGATSSPLRPGPVLATAESPIYAKTILRVESLPFHGAIAAAQVELFDGRSGWVESSNILLAATVVGVAEDDTLNIRSGQSWDSPVVDEAAPDERIFFDPVGRHQAVGMKGCQNEFIPVQTLRGIDGYANCRFVQ